MPEPFSGSEIQENQYFDQYLEDFRMSLHLYHAIIIVRYLRKTL